MNIQLSDHFTYKKLIRFTIPSIMMMIFTSIYSVVDGIFVSNYAGKTPFAAVNFIMPFIMILGAVGFMFGTGGSALVSKTMGEGEMKKARSLFSMLVYISAGCGIIIGALGIVFIRPVAAKLGAEGDMLEECVRYGRIVLLATPGYMLQMEFQNYFITAEKPQMGLFVTVGAGVVNIILDALFVAGFHWGAVGAAIATAISQMVGGIVPLIYFSRPNTSLLRLGRFKFDGGALIKTCTNGSSELMSNISMSLVGMLYNIQLMKYAGEDGVAAYGAMMYVNMIFLAIFIGYSIGIAPVIGYHYGAENHRELKNLLRKSFWIIGISSVGMLLFALLMAGTLSKIFVGYDQVLYEMTCHGFRIYAISFLFSGIAIFGSSFFTALNNGLISAVISFLRTLVFQISAVMLLPLILGIDGVWYSIVAAEMMAAAVSLLFMAKMKSHYHY